MKILLIEDEAELRKSIKQYLISVSYVVESVAEYTKALEKIYDYSYDCVLVDITLPNGNGLDLIQTLKQSKPKTGIIIISARNSLDDKITGLDLGADDYLLKPFHLSELNARIRALMRRKNFDGDTSLVINEITIFPESKQILIQNQEVDLTTKEFQLLLFLITNKNRVVSKNSIAEHLWGDDVERIDISNFTYTQLKNLRKKLTENGCTDYIQTIYGIGYRFKTN